MKKVLSVGVVTALLMIGLVKLTLCFYNDDANLQTAEITVDGKPKKVKACTKCIKTAKKNAK